MPQRAYISSAGTKTALDFMISRARSPRLRTMREFAEQEIRIPDGPHEGRKFNCRRQPWAGLWLDAIDSGNSAAADHAWNMFSLTGPTQSGKSLCGFVIPTLYHLFEIGENVVCGVPDIDIAGDKWVEDFKPAIDRTRYAHLIPAGGSGSRGGKVRAIKFQNGATLRFMTGGGGDKSRSAFTSRILVITETDGLAKRGGKSDEADKVKQMMGRTLSYGLDQCRVYMECTVSTEDNLTWKNHTEKGTGAEIHCPCPKCGEHVRPGREDVKGWEQAETELEAEAGGWRCPLCGCSIGEDARREMNKSALLVHRGQKIEEGSVVGDGPKTRMFSMRYSAFNNMFVKGKDVAAKIWAAARDEDEDNAERELSQFFFAVPPPAMIEKMGQLNIQRICKRQKAPGRGIVPRGSVGLTCGVDVGKHLIHYVVMAWMKDGTARVIDYGSRDVPSKDLETIELAILVALRGFRDTVILPGFPVDGMEKRIAPRLTFVDLGYKNNAVVAFCNESGQNFVPCKGYGASQEGKYTCPANALVAGMDYCAMPQVNHAGEFYFRINSDEWKTRVWDGLECNETKLGAIVLYEDAEVNHMRIARHVTAERAQTEFVPGGKGLVKTWVKVRRENHLFDTVVYACVAAHFVGYSVQGVRVQPKNQGVRRKKRPVDQFGRTINR